MISLWRAFVFFLHYFYIIQYMDICYKMYFFPLYYYKLSQWIYRAILIENQFFVEINVIERELYLQNIIFTSTMNRAEEGETVEPGSLISAFIISLFSLRIDTVSEKRYRSRETLIVITRLSRNIFPCLSIELAGSSCYCNDFGGPCRH